MADERNHQEDHRGNCKPNPNSGNAEGRNRRNEEDLSLIHISLQSVVKTRSEPYTYLSRNTGNNGFSMDTPHLIYTTSSNKRKQRRRNRKKETQEDISTFTLPYIKGTADIIGRILKKHHIRTTFNTHKKSTLFYTMQRTAYS